MEAITQTVELETTDKLTILLDNYYEMEHYITQYMTTNGYYIDDIDGLHDCCAGTINNMYNDLF